MNDGVIIITIIGMAIATYLTRIGGFVILGYFNLSKRIRSGLEYIPGAILISLIAPSLINGGLPELFASVATLLAIMYTKNLIISLGSGIVTVYVLRLVM